MAVLASKTLTRQLIDTITRFDLGFIDQSLAGGGAALPAG